jgi:hypothetical protein
MGHPVRRVLVCLGLSSVLVAGAAAQVQARVALPTADRAAIYGRVIGHGPRAIRILGRARASPRDVRGCLRMWDNLRAEI